jgi:hypothetical protein
MKLRSTAAFTALFVMALSVAVAAPKNRKTIDFTEPTHVGTVTLQPGQYTMEWTGTAPDVQVSFSRGKNTIVTVPAMLELTQNRNETAYAYHPEDSGAHSLVRIETKGLTLHFTATDVSGGR